MFIVCSVDSMSSANSQCVDLVTEYEDARKLLISYKKSLEEILVEHRVTLDLAKADKRYIETETAVTYDGVLGTGEYLYSTIFITKINEVESLTV